MILSPGAVAPEFELPDAFGAPTSLRRLRERGAVALVFFPFAFSRTCHGELCELRDRLELFEAEGVRLAAVSVDSKYALRAWSEQERFGFPLLSDFWPHGAVAQAYGAFEADRGFASRASFVIDASGLVRASFASAAGEPRPIEAYRSALAALRG
ncbi:peroxiredoxin [Agromyces intestinalis]|uniref:Peroxiredoxin n=1 Tax=Agromyces intestinalis TaxID=2592652 RepID=A0A5C1YCZ8_9MICO|nr:peroxiredoxin [Agromyces intestinalis]QEO13059.1 peroxiredoxin [Agromyces intestinalis]